MTESYSLADIITNLDNLYTYTLRKSYIPYYFTVLRKKWTNGVNFPKLVILTILCIAQDLPSKEQFLQTKPRWNHFLWISEYQLHTKEPKIWVAFSFFLLSYFLLFFRALSMVGAKTSWYARAELSWNQWSMFKVPEHMNFKFCKFGFMPD